MHKQKGVSLSGLMVWGFILAMVSLVLIKIAPSAIEFYKIRKDIKAVVQNAGPNATVPELRNSFGKYAEIDHISDIRPADLDIAKEGNQIVISFAYEKKITLFGPVSLLIDYHASSNGQ
ncbi:MAG: DUF4845 domain-containing protein [Rhodocyclales bacterium]|nr:DUF4845 domain-containing protein [Rhodocyclales bacterium]